jgi:two-component system sensor histidine kinase/response regulator
VPKILVIDDDAALRRTLQVALEMFGYEVACAESGAQGLQVAQEILPEVVICDVNMPGMDGRAVLQAMRADPSLGNRQIVLMTGNQAGNPQREGMNLGADDYLPKPFEISQLKTCVEARLRRAQVYRRLEDGMLRRHAELFGATLPHEFMTPLNGILGFAEILKEDYGRLTPDDAQQMLSDIESCARRLHRTLMNYLQLVRFENASDQERAVPAPTVAGEALASLVALTAAEIARGNSRSADVSVEAEPAAARVHEADLRTVVEHLVENACHYSAPATPIRVIWGPVNGRPTLRVIDQGRGMSAEQIAEIGAFVQFGRKQFEQQGLGIGLALVKRLLERQGGVLRFESEEGKGTTAIVELRPPPQPAAPAAK